VEALNWRNDSGSAGTERLDQAVLFDGIDDLVNGEYALD
jgi:hypothetical protein